MGWTWKWSGASASRHASHLPKNSKKNTFSNGKNLDHGSGSRWWFQTFFIFTTTWGNDPIWLIFFKWVETTNQRMHLLFKDCLFPSPCCFTGYLAVTCSKTMAHCRSHCGFMTRLWRPKNQQDTSGRTHKKSWGSWSGSCLFFNMRDGKIL